MNLLPLWNNGFVLAFVLMTAVLAAACLAASRFRLSASAKNTILLPALVVAFVAPLGLVAARETGWTIALPVLEAEPRLKQGAALFPESSGSWTAPPASVLGESQSKPMGRETSDVNDGSGFAAVVRPVVGGLLIIWVAGTLICLVRLGRSYLSLWRLLANARPVVQPRLAATARKAASAVGLAKYPTILVTDRVGSPVAVGTPRHGWVIWPSDSFEQMPDEQLLHVLVHEGAHIAHRDTSLRLLQGLASALLWWHPLVHLLNRQLSRTREELCDNAVLSSADPVQYGQTLLDIERPAKAERPHALVVTLFPEHEQLERRIQNLLNPRRSTMHRSKPSVVTIMCLAGIGVTMLFGATRLTAAEQSAPAFTEAMWLASSDRELVREYSLSLEDASSPGHLDIDIKNGDIRVTAYDGEKLLVRLSVPKRAQAVTPQQLDFKVRQKVNFIELDSDAYGATTHVEVLVPRRINLTLDSYRNGVIRVEGVEGKIRARSNDNDIVLSGVSGTADVYGYNGSFFASFETVSGDLEFETYNGTVELLLPGDLQCTTHISAESQDFRSEFTISERPAEMRVTEREDGTRVMDFGKYVVGDINGGGNRVMIETTNGSVLLRKH